MKIIKAIIYPILFFVFAGCASAPPDVPVCVWLHNSPLCEEVGRDNCGYCVHIISGNDYFIGNATDEMQQSWEQILNTAIIFPHDSYKELAVWIINTCKKTKCHKEISKFKILD